MRLMADTVRPISCIINKIQLISIRNVLPSLNNIHIQKHKNIVLPSLDDFE